MKDTIKIDNLSKKVLIIGANGFLGSNILKMVEKSENIKQNFLFIAADLENLNISKKYKYINIDITDPYNVTKKIMHIHPEVVILTAAMTDVDQNEMNKDLATKINTRGAINVLNACKQVNSKLLFMSTDFVFDGTLKNGNYAENDIPHPINHYGKTKVDAETGIIESDIEYLICRTAVLYGWNKNKLNFITWILNNLEESRNISIITDQVNNATFIENLAQILLKLIEKDATGIYHTVGIGGLSRYQMALKCAEVFGYDKNLISPIEDLQQKARRPKNVELNIGKLRNLIGDELKILSLKEGLKIMEANRI